MILNVCDSGDVLSALRIVRIAIIIIKIVVPIILIVSLMINYMSAVSSKDNDALSRANKNLVPKVISALLVFFIPTFIGLIADATSNSVDYMNCISNATSEGVNNAYKSEAKNYIETARNSLNKSDYNIAAVSIGKVQDESDKNALKNELSTVSKYITLKERINKLKTNYDEAEYKKIKNEINAIGDSKIKKELLELLKKAMSSSGVNLNIQAGTFERSDYDSEMRYIEVIPEGATTNMPLVIYLHGIWSYSSFSSNAPNYKITNYVKSGGAYTYGKFILIVPRVVLSQGDANNMVTWKTSQGREQTQKLKGLIDFIVNKYKINNRKIIITGVSLGGDGTWNMIESYPNFFAAGVPISGCAGSNAVVSNYISTPIVAYHGTGANEDAYKQCVPSIYSKIKRSGGNIQMIVKNGYSHGMMQNVYTDDNGIIFKWMLQQERK